MTTFLVAADPRPTKKTPPLYRKALAWKVSPAPCDISVHDYGIPQWVKDIERLYITECQSDRPFHSQHTFHEVPWCSMMFYEFRWDLKLESVFFYLLTSRGWILAVIRPGSCWFTWCKKDFTLLDSVKHTWCRPYPKKTNKHLFPGAFAEEVNTPISGN